MERTVACSVEEVFDVLIRPETYPHWLVGARDIRAVDDPWPEIGSRFHHRVGLVGPLKVADSTKVIAIEAPTVLALEVRARPLGRGVARFELSPAEGDPGGTVVALHEHLLGSAHRLEPVLGGLIAARNRRSLEQLDDYVCTGRSHRAPG